VRRIAGLPAALPLVALLAVPAARAHAQDWRKITQMRQATASDELLQVALEYAAGNLEVSAGEADLLYRATLRYDADAFEPQLDYSPGRLQLGLSDVRVRGRNIRAGELDIRLGPRVPLDLQLEFGAARANLDLGGLRIRRLHIGTGASETVLRVSSPNRDVCKHVDMDVGAAKFQAFALANLNAERLAFSGGVGDVTLDFTGDWTRNLTAELRMGLGSLTLRVPRGVGVRIRKDGLLVGFDSEGLTKHGNVYESEDWDRAEHLLTINVEAALGSIRVVWVDPERN